MQQTGKVFVFVGGLHRSGTSILAQSLAQHPAISTFQSTGVPRDEGQHLQTIYLPAKAHGGPGRFGFRPAAHLTEAVATRAQSQRLREQWGKYWNLGKPVLLEKSPPNLIQTRFLEALFPRSFFVIILRHPIAVSYATMKWSKTPLHSLVRHWIVCHELFAGDALHLRNPPMLVRYEDFVADPGGAVNSIWVRLGLPALHVRDGVRSGINERYLMRWQRLRSGMITGPYARWIVRRFERGVRNFGYSLDADGDAM